ncbi:MAG: hypothetical protein M0Z61_07770 [Nitrospiraceae bacterium]|nr:hypothetical protein [Nitrospiraceae bacterium]
MTLFTQLAIALASVEKVSAIIFILVVSPEGVLLLGETSLLPVS